MKRGNFEIVPILEQHCSEKEHSTGEVMGVKFIDPKGQEICVYVNCGSPDYITITGDDSIVVQPWSTNVVRVQHSKL